MAKLQCPNCGNDINFLSFIKAPTPWHMKCHKCGLKLQQDRFKWTCMVVAAFFGAVLGAVFIHFTIARESLIAGVAIFILGLVLFEIAAFKLLPVLGVRLEPKNAANYV